MSGPQFMNWYSDYFKDTLPLKMYQEYCQKYEGDGPAWTNVDLGAAEAGRNFDRLSHHQDFSEEGKCDTCGRPLCSSQEQEWGHALQRDDAFEGDKTKRFKEFKAGYLSVKHNILNMYRECLLSEADKFLDQNKLDQAMELWNEYGNLPGGSPRESMIRENHTGTRLFFGSLFRENYIKRHPRRSLACRKASLESLQCRCIEQNAYCCHPSSIQDWSMSSLISQDGSSSTLIGSKLIKFDTHRLKINQVRHAQAQN